MNNILLNDIEFSKETESILENDISEEDKQTLLLAKLENEHQSLRVINSYVFVGRKYNSEIEIWKERVSVINNHIKNLENKKEWLNTLIKNYMIMKNITKIESVGTSMFKSITRVNNNPKLVIDASDKIPGEYIEIIPQEPVKKINTDEIKKSLKFGFSVEGCHLDDTGEHLLIK